MAIKRVSLLNLPVDINATTENILAMLQSGEAFFINLIGPQAWEVADKSPDYAGKLSQMSLVLVDSQILALGCLALTGDKCQPFSFDMSCFAHDALKLLAHERIPMALIGGQPSHDEEVRDLLIHKFPGISIVTSAHGYGDFAPKIAAIMAKQPKVVLVSMVSPRQEDFLLALRDAGFKGCAIGCGDFIDVPPPLVQNYEVAAWAESHNLQTLYKLYKDPQRLTKRAMFDYKRFAYLAIAELIRRAMKFRDKLVGKTSPT